MGRHFYCSTEQARPITMWIPAALLRVFQPFFEAEAANAVNHNAAPALPETFSVKYRRAYQLFRGLKGASALHIAIADPIWLIAMRIKPR